MQTNPISSPEPDDAVLLRAYAEKRDLRAFEQLVGRHAAMVRAVAGRVAGQGAEDVAQIVFAELARRAAALTGVTCLGAWLHRVAATQAKRFVRQQGRTDRKHEAYAAEMNTTSIFQTADDPLHEALPVLDAALNDLQEGDRELIFLRFYEGASFKHLSERLGRNDAALRQQAGRAIERLSAALKRRGVVVPATALTVGLGGVLLPASSSATAGIAALALAARMLASTLPKATTAATTLATLSSTTKALLSAAAALVLVAVPVLHQEVTARASAASLSSASANTRTGQAVAGNRQAAVMPAVPRAVTGQEEREVEWQQKQWFRLILNTTVSQQALKTASALGWTEAQRLAYTQFMKGDMVMPSFDDKGGEVDAHPDMKTPQEACVKYVRENFPGEPARAFETWMAGQEVAFAESAAARHLARFTGAIDMTEAQKEALFQTLANTALKQLREGFQRTAGFTVTVGRADPALHEDVELLATVLTPEQLHLFQINQKLVHDTHEQLKPHGLKILLDHLHASAP